MEKIYKKNEGFTLIEIIVGGALLSILILLSTYTFIPSIKKGTEVSRLSKARAIAANEMENIKFLNIGLSTEGTDQISLPTTDSGQTSRIYEKSVDDIWDVRIEIKPVAEYSIPMEANADLQIVLEDSTKESFMVTMENEVIPLGTLPSNQYVLNISMIEEKADSRVFQITFAGKSVSVEIPKTRETNVPQINVYNYTKGKTIDIHVQKVSTPEKIGVVIQKILNENTFADIEFVNTQGKNNQIRIYETDEKNMNHLKGGTWIYYVKVDVFDKGKTESLVEMESLKKVGLE